MVELVQQLKALEARARAARKSAGKAWSRNAAIVQVGIAKQTVSGWFSETAPRVPKDHDEVWKLVELYSRWAGETPDRRYWSTLVEECRSTPRVRRVSLGRLIDEWDPLSLEVHEAVDAGAATGSLPPLPVYVTRPHDNALRNIVSSALRGTSAMAVLVGGSSTGKTRACWEAVRSLPPPWRLWHPIDPGRPEAVIGALDRGIGPHTVVWLNEIQFYLLPVAGERVAAGLREILRDPAVGPVLVLGTAWPENWWRLTVQPAPNQPDQHAQARELLSGKDIAVPDSFDDAALADLEVFASSDPRLAAANVQPGGRRSRVTQFLAGAPMLVERYMNAPRVAKAILHAAIDLRRYDYGPLIPEPLLCEVAAEYLDPDEFDGLADDWCERALEILCAPSRGLPGPLIRVRARPGDRVCDSAMFRIADFLEQYARDERKYIFPTENFFRTICRMEGNPELLYAVANRLVLAGRNFLAAQLYHRALSLGYLRSAWDLADCLEVSGDVDGAVVVLERVALQGDERASDYFVELLARHGQFERLEDFCRGELGIGNARPLVVAGGEFQSTGKRSEYSDMIARILIADAVDQEQIDARFSLFWSESEAGAARIQASIDRLEKMVADQTGTVREEVLKIESRAYSYLDGGDMEAAKGVIVRALNNETLGIERLAAIYWHGGEPEKAEFVERFGIDAVGLPAKPWSLADLTW